jgi:hypothetical protein
MQTAVARHCFSANAPNNSRPCRLLPGAPEAGLEAGRAQGHVQATVGGPKDAGYQGRERRTSLPYFANGFTKWSSVKLTQILALGIWTPLGKIPRGPS